MATLIAIPIISLLTVIQSAIVSRLPLLHGTPNLILLVLIAWALQERVRNAWQWSLIGGFCIGFVSIIPMAVPIITYISITGLARVIRQRIWENPILVMFVLTLIGSVLSQLTILPFITLREIPYPYLDIMKLVVLPSLLLNLALAAPVYAVVKDLADWVYPEEIKI